VLVTRRHRLVRRGVLAELMDVFFARLTALDAAIRANDDERWSALRVAIVAEKASHACHREQAPAWMLGIEAAPAAAGETLARLPGSPGTAEGTVFSAASSDDFPRS